MRSQRTRARPRGKGFIRRDRGDIPESREGAHEGNATRRAAKGTKCRNTAVVVEAGKAYGDAGGACARVAVEET
ncbi:hypothetical protein ERJ75_001144000 [Trypanosoma vivax]|nr:hypothetical protein ERJ75_001144000 [Trypanosoma vivax]